MINRQLVGSRSPSSAFSDDSGRPRLHRVGNYLKTAVLLAGMTALVLVIGERIGGARGLVFAGFFVAIMNFVTWWFSDRIALAMHGARELDVAHAPWLYEMVQRLTQRAGLPMPKLYVIDMPAPNASTLLQLAISRSREYGADAGAATLTGDPDALADALLKLQRGAEHLPYDRAPATAHMFIVNPLSGGGVLSLFPPPPPLEERVRRLREMRVARGW